MANYVYVCILTPFMLCVCVNVIHECQEPYSLISTPKSFSWQFYLLTELDSNFRFVMSDLRSELGPYV